MYLLSIHFWFWLYLMTTVPRIYTSFQCNLFLRFSLCFDILRLFLSPFEFLKISSAYAPIWSPVVDPILCRSTNANHIFHDVRFSSLVSSTYPPLSVSATLTCFGVPVEFGVQLIKNLWATCLFVPLCGHPTQLLANSLCQVDFSLLSDAELKLITLVIVWPQLYVNSNGFCIPYFLSSVL